MKSSLGQPLVPGKALNEVGSEVIECHSHSHVPVFSVLFVSSKQHNLCTFLKPLLESPTTCTSYDARLMRKPNLTKLVSLDLVPPLLCQKDLFEQNERFRVMTKVKYHRRSTWFKCKLVNAQMQRRSPRPLEEGCSLIYTWAHNRLVFSRASKCSGD